MFFTSASMNMVDRLMASPTMRAPSNAPYADPSPPRTTAAKTRRRIRNPKSHFTWSRPKNVPESAASAAPETHTQVITHSTSMPVDSASSRLSATARIALPIRVSWR